MQYSFKQWMSALKVSDAAYFMIEDLQEHDALATKSFINSYLEFTNLQKLKVKQYSAQNPKNSDEDEDEDGEQTAKPAKLDKGEHARIKQEQRTQRQSSLRGESTENQGAQEIPQRRKPDYTPKPTDLKYLDQDEN